MANALIRNLTIKLAKKNILKAMREPQPLIRTIRSTLAHLVERLSVWIKPLIYEDKKE